MQKGELTIDGACHCGNIHITLTWPAEQSEVPVRRCGCTFCQKHGGAWTSNRNANLVVAVRDRSAVSEYRFGTCTADFLVCAICGVVPVVTSEIEGSLHAVVNVNTFSETPGLTFSGSATDFDGESTSGRLQRRQRNWIPSVTIAGSDGT